MSARTPQVVNAVGTQARAIQSYYPFYPPPPIDEGSITRSPGFAGYQNLPASRVDERTDKGIVNRRNLRMGEVNRYSHGGVMMKPFAMRATGQVESSRANLIENMPNIVQQNLFLYRAAKGYPYNLGISEKVPTLPQAALGNQPSQMNPRPQFLRNIFTRRNYSTAPSIPAQPQAR